MCFASVYDQLSAGESKKPLGGSYEAGEKMLRAADPIADANEAAENGKGAYVRVCGFACTAVGVEDTAGADQGPTIPGTSDAHTAASKGYNDAAYDYASKFNKQLMKRLAQDESPSSTMTTPGSSAGAAPAPEATPIAQALPDSALTLNGVVIGKSNLYNSVGKFGTNMFHKEDGGLYIVCWKGTDGTIVAFESDKAGGGPDQTITEGRLIAAGSEYKYSSQCKESKKVSSALSLNGMKLGDAMTDTSKTQHYSVEKKLGKKTSKIVSDVDVVAADGKITEISVGKSVTH